MNRAIPTKNENDICLVGGGRQADVPVDDFVGSVAVLEWLEILWRTSRPEDDGGAHMRGRE